jgi:hypothetical protein
MFDIVDKIHLLCTMKTVYVNVYNALGQLYNTELGVKRFSSLFGYFLHIGFKMVNRVSDFIDSIQKDIKLTTSKNRKSNQCSTSQQIGQVMNYIISGNTADSQ